jgi:tetratricopeptide (TPR) repeat protein
MRVFIAVVVALSVVAGRSDAGAQSSGGQRWYEAYDEALQAISQKNWKLAEEKLLAAMSSRLAPKPGRSVNTVGLRYIDYLPDYYLGLVYFNQQRYQEAIAALRRSSDLIGPRSREFAAYSSTLKEAEAALAAKVEPPPTNTTPPPVNVPPTNTGQTTTPTQPPLLPSQPQTGYAGTPGGGSTSRVPPQGRGSIPPSSTARGGGGVTGATGALGRGAPSPNNPDGAVAGPTLQTAMMRFFAGSYDQAKAELQRLPTTDRQQFYLACTNAALSFLDPGKESELRQAARDSLARAGTYDSSADRPYIAPKILGLLNLR